VPRIRTLKPEHKQHRKVGVLSDREYRLWIGMLTEADDEGRLVCDASQLRALIFAYHPRVTLLHLEAGLIRLAGLGLVRLYMVAGVRYADFPSWKDHQRINRPMASKLPSYKTSVTTHGVLTEDSVNAPGALTGDRKGSDQGSEAKGSEAKGGESEGRETQEVAYATGSNNGNSGALNDEILQAERRLYGRPLSHLERKGTHPAPPKLSEAR
jgi:hypothetical protein